MVPNKSGNGGRQSGGPPNFHRMVYRHAATISVIADLRHTAASWTHCREECAVVPMTVRVYARSRRTWCRLSL